MQPPSTPSPTVNSSDSSSPDIPVSPEESKKMKEKKELEAKSQALFAQVKCLDLETQEAVLKAWDKNSKEKNKNVQVSQNLDVFNAIFGYQTLKEYLAEHLLDSKYVDHIMESYSKHVMNVFFRNHGLLVLSLHWIQFNYAYLSLGIFLSDAFPKDMHPESSFFQYLRKEHVGDYHVALSVIANVSEINQLQTSMSAFLQDVSEYDAHKYWEAQQKSMQDSEWAGRKIVIVTERNGGAHLAQCAAIREFLSQQGYRIDVIELQLITREYDPLFKNAIKFDDGTPVSADEIYNKLEAQNKDPLQASFLRSYNWYLKEKFPGLYPRDALRDLIKKIRKLQPDLLIHNLPYNSVMASLPYRLNTPLEIIHCDYSFHDNCIGHMQRQTTLPPHVQLTGFGVPCSDPKIFPPGVDPHNPSIHIVGFPTRSAFTPITDPGAIRSLRHQYGVADGHIAYSISRGLLGALAHLKQCVDELILSPKTPSKPVTVIVICGENKESKTFLEEYTRDFPKKGKPFKFVILGLLNATQMNEVFQISDISDIKAGGGTTQEYLVSIGLEGSSRRAIICPAYFWENCNADYLERTGLAKVYDPQRSKKDKIELIEELIGQPPLSAPLVDWKKCLLEIVRKRIK